MTAFLQRSFSLDAEARRSCQHCQLLGSGVLEYKKQYATSNRLASYGQTCRAQPNWRRSDSHWWLSGVGGDLLSGFADGLPWVPSAKEGAISFQRIHYVVFFNIFNAIRFPERIGLGDSPTCPRNILVIHVFCLGILLKSSNDSVATVLAPRKEGTESSRLKKTSAQQMKGNWTNRAVWH